ncbi:meiotic cell cortex C-terminal pleckstrin homology-domain-containing protein [Aspergillus ambiguus]|uniref:putative nuclear migration protein n=1 Tax=Aspergillus ambiguus TaxID=176160 RepID=UPI003CCDABE7
MATDTALQSPPPSKAFPTPSTTPQRTSAIHARGDSSPGPMSSPTSLPTQNFSPGGPSDYDDVIEEDTISPLDPRRFTPTLHASLVSEILSLRRDVENKAKAIDVLERSLDDSRTENEDLTGRLSQSTREIRSLKHQLQLLEGGSSSALTELAKERDDALENISDVRRKLEQAQKRARSREEEVDRTLKLWDREKQSWEGERRSLERKVHVVEGRLKIVLDEVAAAQAAGSFPPPPANDAPHDVTAGKDSDTASLRSSSQEPRRTSVTSLSSDEGDYHNIRYSVASLANMPGAKTDGLNLAEELAFDEEDEFDMPEEHDLAPDSPEALPEERPASANSQTSYRMGEKARKILGLSLQDSVDRLAARNDAHKEQSSPFQPPATFVYRDVGIQYSPPPSPTPSESGENSGREAKERIGETSSGLHPKDSIDMVSTSCQTVAELPTPPWTPKIGEASPRSGAERTSMVCASVQTQEPAPDQDPPNDEPSEKGPSELDVPMIAIHPPCSEPSSPRGSVVLPPQTKNASSQANFGPMVPSRTIGIQTEEIRIDQRPVKLPASLLPSAIQDLPPRRDSQDVPVQPYRPPPPRPAKGDTAPPPVPAKAPGRSRPVGQVRQAYPGNNDNGPLSDESLSELRRPMRSSSLFAGFDQMSDDESPKATRDIFTDDELLNRPFASYKIRRGKLVSAQDRTSFDDLALPEVDEHLLDPDSQIYEPTGADKDQAGPSSAGPRSGLRQQDIRRAAMISNGAAAHQRIRTRSPSEPSLDSGSGSGTSSIAPPFPVPIRLSSRKFPLTGSDGRQSPTPSFPRNFSDRGGHATIVRRPTLRRVRSAAAMSQAETDRPPSRASPISSSSYTTGSSRQRPPLPFDEITMPVDRRFNGSSTHQRTPSRVFSHERHDSAATSVQPTSVVDAIAQTMVGEWMFKYVRRRSFGVGDAKDTWENKNPEEVSANITNSGVRHKRWVWLAPYERAVMWSSKQPISGTALLGKSGRKLTIQSVLDVKDDNPLPKGASTGAPFNRSILILTPKRALKFTATSVERHYVWLTALSFLSHSGIHDLDALPPVPQEEVTAPAAPTAALRRNPIRDSIRIAKGRPRPTPKGKRSFNHPEPVPEIDPTMLDAADPPTVPRFSTHSHNHARKRSNTAPRIPAIRSFSSTGTMPSIASTRASSDTHATAAPPPVPGPGTMNSSVSRRTSETSVRTGNFFDAIGTVRMEAFIDQTESNRYRAAAGRPRHVRKPSNPWSLRHPGYHELDYGMYEPEDPFRGF